MIRFSFSLLAIALVCFTFGCESNERFVGSNTITTEIRDVADFSQVQVASALKASITAGASFSVTVRANENIQERVITRRNGDQLEVRLAPGNYREIDVEVSITLPDLASLEVSGASTVDVSGFTGLNNLGIELSGASNLGFEDATVTDLVANVSGASTANLFSLTSTNAAVNVSGASTLKLQASNLISGAVSGASTVRYRGNPEVTAETSGASQIINAN